MKTPLVIISMAMLSFATILSQDLSAKEKKLIIIDFSFYVQVNEILIYKDCLEDWMSDPEYFSSNKLSASKTKPVLETWMMDLNHFISEDLKEDKRENQEIEKWMFNSCHFYKPQ